MTESKAVLSQLLKSIEKLAASTKIEIEDMLDHKYNIKDREIKLRSMDKNLDILLNNIYTLQIIETQMKEDDNEICQENKAIPEGRSLG